MACTSRSKRHEGRCSANHASAESSRWEALPLDAVARIHQSSSTRTQDGRHLRSFGGSPALLVPQSAVRPSIGRKFTTEEKERTGCHEECAISRTDENRTYVCTNSQFNCRLSAYAYGWTSSHHHRIRSKRLSMCSSSEEEARTRLLVH